MLRSGRRSSDVRLIAAAAAVRCPEWLGCAMVVTRAVSDVLEAFRQAVDALVGVDPAVLADGPSVVELLAELSRVEAVVCRQAASFDAGGSWAFDEANNSSEWVTTSARVTRRQSRRRLDLGRALRAMPLVEAAFLAGTITAEHVEALGSSRERSPPSTSRRSPTPSGRARPRRPRSAVMKQRWWRGPPRGRSTGSTPM
jgi:hypothetical protein